MIMIFTAASNLMQMQQQLVTALLNCILFRSVYKMQALQINSSLGSLHQRTHQSKPTDGPVTYRFGIRTGANFRAIEQC